jgi:DNA-binding transcriptional ArsR family regulator
MRTAALPHRPPTVEVVASPAAELLMTAAVVTDEARSDYAVGRDWFAAVEREAGAELYGRVLRCSGGSDMVWAHLLSVVHESPPPRDVPAFLQHLATTDPRELKLRLVGHYVRFFRRATPPEVIAAAVDGDTEAQRQFLATSYPTATAWQAALRHLLPLDATRLRDELTDVLADWDARVFQSRAAALTDALSADAERITALSRTHDAGALAIAVSGEECPLEHGIRHLLILPSVVMRPLLHRFDHHDTKILVVPAADSSLRHAPDAPPQSLTRTLRALGDERRLRILHQLGGGDLRLAELARRTRMPATTLLHHVSVLRAAGLVQPLPGDRGYGLRAEALDDLPSALTTWLGIQGEH